MKKIEYKELRLLQIEILNYVDNFCKRNNLKYSLACGTLLGAIRHKGYIPWDDDIDIQFLRDDYNKFITLWIKQGNHPYELLSLETTSYWGMAYAKVCNSKTIIKDGNYNFYGVNIDIFPIDKVVDFEDFSKRHKQIMNLYTKLHLCTYKSENKWKNILNKLRCIPYTPHRIALKIHKIAISKNDKEGEYLFEMVAGRLYKNIFHKEAFDDVVEMEFEGKLYNVLKGWDTYLRSLYNDYMTLPPKEKQITHHNMEAYWK